MYRLLFLGLVLFATLHGSAIPNFKELEKTKNAVFFLSTPRSGTNIISGSLSAITRKPISFLEWKEKVFKPNSSLRDHPAYNRLELPLVSEDPLFYRTHGEFEKLRKIPSRCNKLIFVTRNPKELLFRKFFLEHSSLKDPSFEFIKNFLQNYLECFKVYEGWSPANKQLVFYEDFIRNGDEILLELLEFMGERQTYLWDFQANKDRYIAMILESYQKQHHGVSGGLSARHGPTEIYYTKNVSLEMLSYIDDYLKDTAPVIWEKYLSRFQSLPSK